MSARGIEISARMFERMQQLRYELIREAEEHGLTTAAGQQDLFLARLWARANDHVKEDFLTAVSWPPAETK